MQIEEIKSKILPYIEQRNCYLVDISISKDTEIFICIDSFDSSVQMDDCVAINNAFLELFDQEVEDYALTVSSAGLDQPFKVRAQYDKAVGKKVEVLLKGGKKLLADLEAVNDEGVELAYQVKEAVPGSKKKVLVDKKEFFPFTEINAVYLHIDLS